MTLSHIDDLALMILELNADMARLVSLLSSGFYFGQMETVEVV